MTTLDEYIDERVEHWHQAQTNGSCACRPNHPPCDFCDEGYSLTLAEFIQQCAQEWEDAFGWDSGIQHETDEERYDRIMRDLF